MGTIKGIGIKVKYNGMEYIPLSEICEDAGEDAKIRSDASMKTIEYEKEFENLCQSIMMQGQVMPITIRPLTDVEKNTNGIGPKDNIYYAIKNGRTRIKALKELQTKDKTHITDYEKVLAIISTDNNDDTDRITAAISNFSRVEMIEYDKAQIIKDIQKQKNPDTNKEYSIRDIAGILGVSKSYVGKLAKMEFDPETHERVSPKPNDEKTITLVAVKEKIIKNKILDKISAIQKEDDVQDTEKAIQLADELKEVINALSVEVKRINNFPIIKNKRRADGKTKAKENLQK